MSWKRVQKAVQLRQNLYYLSDESISAWRSGAFAVVANASERGLLGMASIGTDVAFHQDFRVVRGTVSTNDFRVEAAARRADLARRSDWKNVRKASTST